MIDDKTIAEIEARHAHDIDALNSEPDNRWRLGAYAEKLLDDRAALLAIVKRQQEECTRLKRAWDCAVQQALENGSKFHAAEKREAAMREALIHARNQMQHPDQLIDEALAGGPTNG